MSRARLLGVALVLLGVVCGPAWVRSAWLMPERNYPFDFSINFTGARLLRDEGHAAPLYDREALAAESASYSPEGLYTRLFLTYIQTPLTAVLTLPLAGFSLDRARFTWLALSNLMLVGSAAVMLYALGPSRLLIGAALVIFATDEAMFDSLRLGQVDGLIALMLALSFLALRKGHPRLIGAPLAVAAVLKVSPALVLGYFIWRRDWRVVGGALVAAALVLALSVAVAGVENHRTFLRETLPRLAGGSTFYDNVSLGGAVARAYFGETSWYYEDSVSGLPGWLRAVGLIATGGVILWSYVVARRDAEAGFMLACAVAVFVAPISWSFYPTWLIPSLLFLVRRCELRRAWGRLALLALLYPLLAIVPAHFGQVDDALIRWPLKTAALALYCALLAWEAQSGQPRAGRPLMRAAPPDVVGARS